MRVYFMSFFLFCVQCTASFPECPIGHCIVYLLESSLKNKIARNIHISSKVSVTRR